MNQRPAIHHFVLAIFLMACAMVRAAEPMRLAVICADKSAWSDLLMARLSKSPEVALVERDDLGKAVDEIEIKELLGDRKKRSRFGEIVGADFLVLLSVADNRARLVVCDTHLGVTLQDQSIGIAEQPQEKVLGVMADVALQTIQSFSGGVKQVVAVPDFVCRDLTFDFNYLQSDYAKVLHSAYRLIPGTAVVTIEEAKAIAAERDITGLGQKERIVSIFIEGEYRTTRDLQSGGVSVEITLRARDSDKVLMVRKLPSVPTSQAGKEMMSVFTKDLVALTQTGEINIDEKSQFRILIERADEFSKIGEFLRSTELREAAMLLKPDDDAQRLTLIREYVRNNRNLYLESNGWPMGTNPADISMLWVAIAERAVSDWMRSLQHCEYLTINHRLSRGQAADASGNAIRSLLGSRLVTNDRLKECDERKRNFVRHVFSQIAHWDPASRKVKEKNLAGESVHFEPLEVYRYIFGTTCSGIRKAEDLDLVSDLLTHLLPDSMPRSPDLICSLKTIAILIHKGDSSIGFTLTEYQAFLERLLASDRPLIRVYGRYGYFCLRQAKGENLPALLKEMQGVLTEAEALGYEVGIYDGFITVFREEVRWMNEAIAREITHTTSAPPRSPPPVPPPSVDSAPQPKSRVSLERIDLRLANTKDRGKLLTEDMDWQSPDGWGGVSRYRPLTTGLDAMWGSGVVFFMPRPGELVQVLADKKLKVSDVVCDGRYVWVGSAGDWGLSVLDLSGRELNRIGQKDGLPPCGHYGILAHAIEPGCVMVAGSFGSEHRGWIAMVRFDGAKSKVEVIHEATKLHMNPHETDRADPAICFEPTAMIEHAIPGTKPRRIIFIGRGAWAPLMIDIESLKVQVYPGNETNNKRFPRFNWATPDDAFLSDQGILWVAIGYGDFSSYRLNDETGLLDPIRVHPESNIANMTSGSLVREGEWLYYSGQDKWRRLNLRTGAEEMLLEYTNHLPHYGTSRTWHLHHSNHYGLVAFNEGCLYRVKITSSESAKNESIMNPERVASYAFLGSSLGLIFIANLYRRRQKRAIPSLNAG